MKTLARPALRSAATSISTMAGVRIRALTERHPIKPTSPRCHSAWQLNLGRHSTYRRGKSVQTTGTTSELHTCAEAAYRFQLMHIEAVKSGEAKQNEPTAPGLLAVAFWERGWRVIRYRGSYFDSPMATGKKPILGHHVI